MAKKISTPTPKIPIQKPTPKIPQPDTHRKGTTKPGGDPKHK